MEDWIFRDCFFDKIENTEIYHDNSIIEFITNTILTHPNAGSLFRKLSKIFVLIAMKYSECYLKKNEKSWKDVMSLEQYGKLNTNNSYIIGYILIDDDNFIDFIDTRIRGHNIAKYMMSRYYEKFSIILQPKEIIKSAVKYWLKIIDVISIEELEEYIADHEINKNMINWNELYTILE